MEEATIEWEECLEKIEDRWNTDYGTITISDDRKTLELTTGGWSENEELMDAISDSMFWILYWRKSERGGKYTFSKE